MTASDKVKSLMALSEEASIKAKELEENHVFDNYRSDDEKTLGMEIPDMWLLVKELKAATMSLMIDIGSKASLEHEMEVMLDRTNITINKGWLEKQFRGGTVEMCAITLKLLNACHVAIGNDWDKRGAHYDLTKNKVFLKESGKYASWVSTVYHESWHAIDNKYHQIKKYDKELREEITVKYEKFAEFLNRGIWDYPTSISCDPTISTAYITRSGKTFFETFLEELFSEKVAEIEDDVAERPMYHLGIADFIAFKRGDSLKGVGHDGSIWGMDMAHGAHEAFAEVAAAVAINNVNDDMKEYFPKTIECFMSILDDIKSGKLRR